VGLGGVSPLAGSLNVPLTLFFSPPKFPQPECPERSRTNYGRNFIPLRGGPIRFFLYRPKLKMSSTFRPPSYCRPLSVRVSQNRKDTVYSFLNFPVLHSSCSEYYWIEFTVSSNDGVEPSSFSSFPPMPPEVRTLQKGRVAPMGCHGIDRHDQSGGGGDARGRLMTSPLYHAGPIKIGKAGVVGRRSASKSFLQTKSKEDSLP